MRILCIGDSLGRPRLDPEPIVLEFTWPYLLSKKLTKHSVVTNLVPSRMSKDVLHHYRNDIVAYNADLVLVQVGVVEIYPRVLKRVEKEIISRIPFVNRYIHSWIKRNRVALVRRRKVSYGSAEAYIENLNSIRKNLSQNVIFIPPLFHPYYFEENVSPGYNKLVKDLVLNSGCFDWFKPHLDEWEKYAENYMISDGHHLSINGHKRLSEIILKVLENEYKMA